ncbi:hypothetical protein COOONC_10480, partial [Cooperia oncophora]
CFVIVVVVLICFEVKAVCWPCCYCAGFSLVCAILFSSIVSATDLRQLMVIKFTSNVVDPPALLYMGVDKYENEELIKVSMDGQKMFGFYVTGIFATVYLRLPKGMTIDTIPQALIDDCCQLVKAMIHQSMEIR